MPSITILLLLISSSAMMTYGRSMTAPDQLMPFIFSVADGENNGLSPSSNPTRFIQVIEQIIKYVSSIKSTEQFIDNIVNRQKDIAEKTKVLAFLNKCFLITQKVIEYEIHSLTRMSSAQKKSHPFSPLFTLEELQLAQSKVNDLLMGIERRLATLKTWIPPTMPFLGFF